MKPAFPRRRQVSGARSQLRFHPHVETLETRYLPSTVTNLLDSGPGSLRQAILDTPAGGTVDFQADLTGTITLTSGELAIRKDLTISGPGATAITVSGNNASRVFEIAGPFTVSVSGLTIADGLADSASGGGILNNGTLTVTDSVISGNTASSGWGGGVANNGTLTLSRCTVSGNSADMAGGGVFNFYGTMTLADSTVSGNTTPGNGGGINNNTNGTLMITGSTLSGNSATSTNSGIGGAIVNFAALAVTNSAFANNSATAFGGGIENDGPGPLSVANSTISGNIAGFGGGGVDLSGAPGPTFGNTVLAGNAAPSSPDVRGPLDSQGYNLIGNGSGGSGYADTDLVGTAANPLDPLLGPLQDNGGPTQTMAPLPGSPALNVGDPDQLGSPDQRGVLRMAGVNIGAYQASATGFSVTAPDTSGAGVPFDVTVTAVDRFGQVALGYTGTVTFSSADPYGATLPPDATFSPGDYGSQTYPAGATLYTAGTWDVTATDTSSGITGSATVTVTPAAAVAFVVTAPDTVVAGTPFDFTVTAVDPYGNTDTNYQGTVVFSTMDPAGTFNPTGYTFQLGDMGTALFPMGATLNAASNTWDITATDTASGITGSAYVTVNDGPAPRPSPRRGRGNALAPVADAPDIWAVDYVFTTSGRHGPDAWSWASLVEGLALA
jgi:hypothetical protein